MDKKEYRVAVRDQIMLPHASEIVCLAVIEKEGDEYRICGRKFFKSVTGLQLCGMHTEEISAAAHRTSNRNSL